MAHPGLKERGRNEGRNEGQPDLRDLFALRVEENRADQPVLVGFPAAYVFDVSQTEGNPLPEFSERVSGNAGEYRDRLVDFVIGSA